MVRKAGLNRVQGNLYTFLPRTAVVLTARMFFEKAYQCEMVNEHEALDLYEQALSYDPSLWQAWINSGGIYFRHGKFSIAEVCYRRALDMNPGSVLAHFDLGCVLEEQDRMEEAVEHYLQTVAIDPAYADAHFNLGLAYKKMQNWQGALKHFKIFLSCPHHADDPAIAYARLEIKGLLPHTGLVVVPKASVSAATLPGEVLIAKEG